MKINICKLMPVALMAVTPWFISSCATNVDMAPPAPAYTAAESDATVMGGAVAKVKSRSARAPRNRPGLGTGWGNEVSSDVGYSSFVRSSSKPAGLASIYYNDKEGVAEMTGPWKFSGSGMQRAASGRVEWGVKSGWSMLKNYNSGSRRYVVGRKGSNYKLVVKNISRTPLEIVLSVDGLDVMDGKTASFKKRGYIVQPGKTLSVAGFRTSESAVAAFKFSSVSGSYANLKHGNTRNVGVIGMAVFTPRGASRWKVYGNHADQRHSASPFAEAPRTRAR